MRHLTHLSWHISFVVAWQYFQNNISAGCLELLLEHSGVPAHLSAIHLKTNWIKHFSTFLSYVAKDVVRVSMALWEIIGLHHNGQFRPFIVLHPLCATTLGLETVAALVPGSTVS